MYRLLRTCSKSALVLTVVLSGWCHAVSAQASARSIMLAFRDSIGAVRNVTAIRALEHRTLAIAHGDRNDPVIHLRLGFIGLRLGDLTRNSNDYRDAVGEFQWAARLDSTNALAWYGLGMAEFGRALTVPPAIRNMEAGFLHDPIGAAALDLAKSDRGPAPYPDGIARAALEALRRNTTGWTQFALDVVRDAAGSPGAATHDGVLAHARIEREFGVADSALRVIAEYLKVHPDDPAVLLEQARIRFIGGRTDGDVPWYRGLELADPATLALYRADLAGLTSDTVRRALAQASGAERVREMARFWRTRDELSPDGAERLRDHYRRLDAAHLAFPLAHRDTVHDVLAAVDIRGITMVRHGKPTAAHRLKLSGIPSNDTWWYEPRDDDSLAYVFAKYPKGDSVRLLPTVHQYVTKTIGAPGSHQFVDSARKAIALLADRFVTAGARSPDTWTFGYELALPANLSMTAIGTGPAGPQLQIAYSVAGKGIVPERSIDNFVYRLRLRAVLINSASDVAGAIDTTVLVVRDSWLPDDSLLTGRAVITAPAGTYVIRDGLESDDVGVVTPRQSVTLATLDSSALTLSGIALGRRSVPIAWRLASGDSAWIDPSLTFPRDEPMELTVQAGGLPPERDVPVELAFVRMPDSATALRAERTGTVGGGSSIRVDLADHHTRGVATIRRSISLGALKSGWYVVQVRVAVPNGASATRVRAFRVE
jgi:hypothetical protein